MIDLQDFNATLMQFFGGAEKTIGNDWSTGTIGLPPDSPLLSFTLFAPANLSKGNPFLPIPVTATLEKVFQAFSRSRLHRMPVIAQPSGGPVLKLESLVAQSDLIIFLAAHLTELGPWANLRLSELRDNFGVGTFGEDVVTIPGDAKVIDALSLMEHYRISTVPVVKKSGSNRVIGQVNLLDFPSAIDHLTDTCQFFVSLKKDPIVSLSLSSPLSLLLQSVANHKGHCHSVVLTGQSSSLIGVVTLTDVIDLVTHIAKAERRIASVAHQESLQLQASPENSDKKKKNKTSSSNDKKKKKDSNKGKKNINKGKKNSNKGKKNSSNKDKKAKGKKKKGKK